ncbi:hypothetical protein ASD24_25210 [Paenibacillus sp. Root52]|uniref:Uncharacterized protein n=1 Tax=Paenibacillus amylolyticus TaxID=1451 RepID=A0AAP5LNW9_PAEAM|nr:MULTISPECIES: hypothetical protein [Paenibacillus]KQY90202.1 hypothetical protein ASD24_25210 [Paenibacillus sp. Root52]MDR6725691.1 hypothetical protein [Paenibacillus amylolyticus]
MNSKNELDDKVRHIRQNELSIRELIEFLDSKQIYIISNTMIRVVELKIKNILVIEKLQNLTQYMGARYTFAEGIGIGNIAMASLSILNTSDSLNAYHVILENLKEVDIQRIEKAIVILNDLTNTY